jgi:lipoate-protein ligase A
MKSVDCKVPGGKLLRVDFEREGDMITKIKISGDFFMHPENFLEKLEELILKTPVSRLNDVLESAVRENSVQIIGFSIKDLTSILTT